MGSLASIALISCYQVRVFIYLEQFLFSAVVKVRVFDLVRADGFLRSHYVFVGQVAENDLEEEVLGVGGNEPLGQVLPADFVVGLDGLDQVALEVSAHNPQVGRLHQQLHPLRGRVVQLVQLRGLLVHLHRVLVVVVLLQILRNLLRQRGCLRQPLPQREGVNSFPGSGSVLGGLALLLVGVRHFEQVLALVPVLGLAIDTLGVALDRSLPVASHFVAVGCLLEQLLRLLHSVLLRAHQVLEKPAFRHSN